ncbi:hypothetical protein K438DRAFT_1976748 [Mycena galopus ATCC 62051]|nr:hypothetical protein K438DRAFT_1976748 [Mycena galopus ATCC 62051]
MFPVVFLFFVASTRAITLSLPSTFDSGTVSVQWTLSDGDPTSFGLMQRNLGPSNAIISVTPVENEEGANSGTISVLFPTSGQILLSPIAQLSLAAGDTPDELDAGPQLTVNPGSDAEVLLNVHTPNPDNDVDSALHCSILDFHILNFHILDSSTLDCNLSQRFIHPSRRLIRAVARSRCGHNKPLGFKFDVFTPSVVAISVLLILKLSLPATDLLSSGSSLSPSSSSFSTSSTLSFKLSPGPTQKRTLICRIRCPHCQPGKSGPNRSIIIAVAVVLPVVVLLAILFSIIRRQRISTRHRVARFSEAWARTHTPDNATIFGSPTTAEEEWSGQSDWVQSGQPVSAPEAYGDDPTSAPIPAPIQLMLAARNAVREQASASASEVSDSPPDYVTVE